jgi:hypothetical protein
MESCAAVENRRTRRLSIAAQLNKLPHDEHLHAVAALVAMRLAKGP